MHSWISESQGNGWVDILKSRAYNMKYICIDESQILKAMAG